MPFFESAAHVNSGMQVSSIIVVCILRRDIHLICTVLSASVDRQYCHICYIVYINHTFFFLEMYKQFKDINLLVKEFSSKYLNGMSLTKNPSYIQTKP